jgi:6-phosphogluconolactonase
MSFLRAAGAALVGKKCLPRWSAVTGLVIVALVLASCGDKSVPAFGQHQNAYITLPGQGSVLFVQINSITGEITTVAQTPQIVGISPRGLAIINKFMYVANSAANTVSLFNIANDGTLSQTATPTPAGSGPTGVMVDPSGQYLLVTNSFSNNISVFSIDSSSGALTPVDGSPFYANQDPGEILMPPSGDLVYVTNSGIGTVTGFTFSTSTGQLTSVGAPYYSGAGAAGMAVDSTGNYLYVANTSAVNNPATSVGNISGFNINQTQGASYGTLTAISGSPFTAIAGSGPTNLVASGNFIFATTPGGSYSVWVFTVNSTNGQLVATVNSPFSVASGNLFALIDASGGFFYIGSSTGIQAYTYNQNNGEPQVIDNSPFATGGTSPGKMVISP